jgi:hypothetical protein
MGQLEKLMTTTDPDASGDIAKLYGPASSVRKLTASMVQSVLGGFDPDAEPDASKAGIEFFYPTQELRDRRSIGGDERSSRNGRRPARTTQDELARKFKSNNGHVWISEHYNTLLNRPDMLVELKPDGPLAAYHRTDTMSTGPNYKRTKADRWTFVGIVGRLSLED